MKSFVWFLQKNKIYFLIFFGILLLVIGILSFFYTPKISFENKNGEINEAKILAERVGKLMFLPQDELPTIATVSDPEALKNQSFFQDAKKGDKVLIYPNAKKAILYNPFVNKIITIAPVNIDENERKNNDFKLEINKEGF